MENQKLCLHIGPEDEGKGRNEDGFWVNCGCLITTKAMLKASKKKLHFIVSTLTFSLQAKLVGGHHIGFKKAKVIVELCDLKIVFLSVSESPQLISTFL